MPTSDTQKLYIHHTYDFFFFSFDFVDDLIFIQVRPDVSLTFLITLREFFLLLLSIFDGFKPEKRWDICGR